MGNGEFISLIIGAGIGLVSSIIILIVERFLDTRGKLNIYYKFTAQKGIGSKWGFYNTEAGMISLIVPVIYEIQNTSNSTRVVRDVSLLAYKGDKLVKKLTQANYYHLTKHTGNKITGETDVYFGAEKGSYSFVIEPRSIERFECEYMLKIDQKKAEEIMFDNLILQYCNEKDKKIQFKIREVESAWTIKSFESDEDWQMAK